MSDTKKELILSQSHGLSMPPEKVREIFTTEESLKDYDVLWLQDDAGDKHVCMSRVKDFTDPAYPHGRKTNWWTIENEFEETQDKKTVTSHDALNFLREFFA